MAVELIDPRCALEVAPRTSACRAATDDEFLRKSELGALVLTSPNGPSPLRPICFMSSKASPAPCRSKRKSGMVLFSTRMSSSGRSRSRSARVCAENVPLQVLGLPLVPPSPGVGSGPSTPR